MCIVYYYIFVKLKLALYGQKFRKCEVQKSFKC